MVYEYKENNCFDINEFKKFVDYAFNLCDEIEINESHKHISQKSRKVYEKILEGNPTRYIPHIKELVYWKKLKTDKNPISKENLIKLARCVCEEKVIFDKSHMVYRACCKEHTKEFRLKNSKLKTFLKYGVEYNLQNKKTLEKTQACWGESKTPFGSKEIQERSKNTMLEKYGKDNAMKVKEFTDKSRSTRLKKYGSEFANSEKAKATMQERYGVEYFSQTDKFKKLWPKNGGSSWFNTLVREKEYKTKRQNNSFNTSKPEERILLYLIEKFGEDNILTQYKSERYPFKCDFYVKSLDLFIEYQGSWTHGDHPFDPSDEKDLKILSLYKEKANLNRIENNSVGYYDCAINVWTKVDPEKRRVAKQNKLNWVEFFSEKEFLEWLERYK